jgi:tetratricopeptide (TPR) repeat protein
VAYSDEAVSVSRRANFMPGLGGALGTSTWLAFVRGDFDAARAACDEVLASRDRQLPMTVALILVDLGYISFAGGDYAAADIWFQQAADLASTTGTAAAHNAARGLAATALALGDPVRALRVRAATLERLRDVGRAPEHDGFWPDVLAAIAFEENDFDQAEQILRRGVARLDIYTEWYFPAYLVDFANISLARGHPDRAAVLLGASDALRERVGITVFPLEWPPPSRTILAARAALGDDAFSLNWKTGRALSRDLAAAYALGREDSAISSDESSETHD